MRKAKMNQFVLPVALAVVIGVMLMLLLQFCWGYISTHSPVPHWLGAIGMRGEVFSATLFCADLLVNIFLCLPAAFVLCCLRPSNLALYLPLSVIPSFVWQYRLFFDDTSLFQHWNIFVPGVLLSLIPLPIAALIIRGKHNGV